MDEKEEFSEHESDYVVRQKTTTVKLKDEPNFKLTGKNWKKMNRDKSVRFNLGKNEETILALPR